MTMHTRWLTAQSSSFRNICVRNMLVFCAIIKWPVFFRWIIKKFFCIWVTLYYCNGCVCVCVCVYACTCMCVCMCACVCTCVCMLTYVCTYMCTYLFVAFILFIFAIGEIILDVDKEVYLEKFFSCFKCSESHIAVIYHDTFLLCLNTLIHSSP